MNTIFLALRFRLILFAFFTVGILSYAQDELTQAEIDAVLNKKKKTYKDKDDTKYSVGGGIGLTIYPFNTKPNSFNRPTNIYAEFTPGLQASALVRYHLNEYLLWGSDLEVVYASKSNYRLLHYGLGASAQFFPLKRDKKWNPFAGASLSLQRVSLSQEAHSNTYLLDTSGTNSDFGTIVSVRNNFEKVQLGYGPIPMFRPYIGLEYKINRKFSINAHIGYTWTLASRAPLEQVPDFAQNNGILRYAHLQTALHVRLMKDKPPVYDTNRVEVPDQIALLDVNENDVRKSMLTRDDVFDIIMREGQNHVVHLSVGNHDIIIEEETIPNDCKVSCYLYNDKEEIIARAESTPEGKIVFSNLENGIYDLTFVLEKPCTESNFKYHFPDPHNHVLLQYNSENHMSDTILYNIEGKLLIPDSANFKFVYESSALFVSGSKNNVPSNFDLQIKLGDEKKKVIKQFDPSKDLVFHFRKLPAQNYEVMYKAPDAEVRTGIQYTVYDNFRFAVKHGLYEDISDTSRALNKVNEDNHYEQMKYQLKGKITREDTNLAWKDIKLYLVNQRRRIVATKFPEKDGTFYFKNLKSKNDYDVYYETPGAERAQLQFKIEEPVYVRSMLPKVEARLLPDFQAYETGVTYDIKGKQIKPKGYGVLVGAYENILNVERLCKNLKASRYEPIQIQVAWTGSLNKKYGFSRNFILHKVVIGEFEKERSARKLLGRLQDQGFEAYIISHFE